MNNGRGNIFVVLILLILASIGVGFYLYLKQVPQQSLPQQTKANVKEKGDLVIAETTDEDGVKADTKEFQPFINYLVNKLGSYGIVKGKFISVPTVAEMAQLVRTGQVDMVVDSAFPVYEVSKLAGVTPIADRWKGGAETYHTAIFVKKDSKISSVGDLLGKSLAFDSTSSTVGYFLPKAELIQEGYSLQKNEKTSDPCPARVICYVFVHGNVYDVVAHNITPAGAESELEIDAFFKNNIDNYRMIWRSPDIYRFLVATSPQMSSSLRSAIETVLVTMHTTDEGRNVLSSFGDTTKFTAIENTE
ncbi:MAG: phosphate/phosphite/phosphonate ABC transporter substrate-binding protein, partial [Patescibacteria group bacterium]|nr:phosphate/phosphite/phosphonate ABC transporter substrate-binding protein [Patescibacteria group bacterium]